jgi:predicted ATP-dependent endonuclease of OLD family
MIKKLIIDNYRSFEHEEIDLGPLNAFVGPNNAGKSNIMAALNLVLGDVWPSIRSFNKKDFHNYLPGSNNPIRIVVKFDSPLSCDNRVHGFRLTFDGNDCEYLPIDDKGNIMKYTSGREIRVSNEMKNEVALMYLGLNREASDQIKVTQWTLYGKLLRYIEKQIEGAKRDSFHGDIKTSYDSNIYPAIEALENLLREHVMRQTGMDLNLHLSVLDPVEILKNLRPFLKEYPAGKEFDVEDMGAGTQSALAVAVARAYAKIVKQPLVMAIEEPELYLHPHGCRNFYKLLRELSEDGVQVIYTTHERSFVGFSDFQSIHLVRKEAGKTKVCSGIQKSISSSDEILFASKFSDEVSEVFFANKVVLVESMPDKVACCLALEELKLELDKENVSVIECDGNENIKPICEVLSLFNIPVCVLLDEDPGNTRTRGIISGLKSFLGDDRIFLQKPNLEAMFGLPKKPNKKDALIQFPAWFAKHKPPDVYEELKKKLEY